MKKFPLEGRVKEREQIINFLLSAIDGKDRIIDDLQKKIAEMQRKLDEPQTAKS